MVVHAPGVPVAGGVLEVSTDAINACCNIKAAGFLRLVRAADSALRRGSRLVAIGGHYGFEPSAYAATAGVGNAALRSEEHTSELQSLMHISYAVFCLKKKT